ncbi:MAG: hypothetical protein DRR42_17280 [Gammaproteobacteria bacterium]|nr:MAG: hypothetical protein DRR42_17280 [Gammaproteobacteria bacterium]
MNDSSLLIEPLPSGWRNRQLSDLCSRVKDSYKPVEGGVKPYIGLAHLAQGFPAFVGCGTEGDIKSSKTAFKLDDILFGKLRPYLRKGAQADFEGICSTDIIVFRAFHNCDPKYLKYLIHSDEFIDYAKSTTSGVQHPRTSWPSLQEFRLSLPPLPEQKKIAHILSTVQRAIEAQERIIQTTTELKKALMHKLFTEGLRNEPQKQTEIGLTPESWELLPIDDLFETQLGKMLSQKAKVGDSPKLYLRNKNVQWGRIDTDDLLRMDFNDREAEKFLLQKGDLLVCEGGEIGRAALWDGSITECYYQKALHRLRPKTVRITNEYMAHWMMFAFLLTNTYGVTGTRTTIAHLPEIKLKPLLVPISVPAERNEIVRVLDLSEQRIENHRRKHTQLQGLFRTLLHELMTAKTRVTEITF